MKLQPDGVIAEPATRQPRPFDRVLAGTTVGKNIASHRSKFNGGIKLSVGEQTGVSSDLGPVELQLQTAVKIDPKAPLFRFTRLVCYIR